VSWRRWRRKERAARRRTGPGPQGSCLRVRPVWSRRPGWRRRERVAKEPPSSRKEACPDRNRRTGLPVLKVRVFDRFGEQAFELHRDPAPKLDPSTAPSFTPKQGQFLALIYNHTKIHGRAPSELELQRCFRACGPRHDQDSGAEWLDRTNTRAGPIDPPSCRRGAPAAMAVSRRRRCHCSWRGDVTDSFPVRFKRRSDSPLKKKARRGFRGYPVATVAFYGPDDTRASKCVVGVVNQPGAGPGALQRWFIEEGDARTDPAIGNEMASFTREHGAMSVVMVDRIIGCPHEEGIDYPDGEVCPQCPFWAGRDRWSGDVIQ